MVLEHIDELPVVTEELGDTWIHGVATDPYKTAAYYELLRLRDEWEKEEPEAVDSPAWRDFCGGLLMVCEHSWGRDVKRWLSDWRNWEKQDFYRARERDHITPEDVMPAGELLREFTLHNEPTFVQGLCSYKLMEESWAEQRGYIEEAVAALPEKWRQRAIERLDTLRPKAPVACANPTQDRSFEIGGHSVTVDGDGTVNVDGSEGRGLCLCAPGRGAGREHSPALAQGPGARRREVWSAAGCDGGVRFRGGYRRGAQVV